MVVTYYIKLFRTGADRHNGILISLLPFFIIFEGLSVKQIMVRVRFGRLESDRKVKFKATGLIT